MLIFGESLFGKAAYPGKPACLAQTWHDLGQPPRAALRYAVLMQGYSTVLVPLDGSVEAESALEHALRVTAEGATIHLFRVVDLVAPHYLPDDVDREALWATQSEPAERYLAVLASRAESARHCVVTSVGSGPTAAAICHYARDIKADLVVMATHARTGLSQLLMGSVATEVVKDCGRPVLLSLPKGSET